MQATEERIGSVSALPLAPLEHWMSRYQQSDPAAPGALAAAISPALLRFFRYNWASRDLAEDLLQETFLKIHRMRRSYRPGEAVLPWVYAIARNVRVDNYRRLRRIVEHEAAADVLYEAAGRNDGLESALEFDALVAQLPDAQREVIVMLKATGMTVEEVARATSSTVGAVKLKAHRAYESLRALLTSRAPRRIGRIGSRRLDRETGANGVKIYFGFTVAGDRSSIDTARKVVHWLEEMGHEVLTRHLVSDNAWEADRSISAQDVYRRDMAWLEQCDLFLAEVSGSSFGLGFETGYLLGATSKKVVLLYRREVQRNVSLLITGNTHANCTLVPYDTVEEVIQLIARNHILR